MGGGVLIQEGYYFDIIAKGVATYWGRTLISSWASIHGSPVDEIWQWTGFEIKRVTLLLANYLQYTKNLNTDAVTLNFP